MSVYRRGNVYWYEFRFRGQRLRESTGFSNRTAAHRAEAIRRAQLTEGRAGIVRRERCPKFEDFVKDEFLPWSEREHAAHPRTHERYQVSTRPLVGFFGKLPLDTITSGQVEKFKLLRSEEVSPAGTNRDVATLRLILNLAIRQGLVVARNPVQGVKFLPEGPGMMRWFRTTKSEGTWRRPIPCFGRWQL